MKIGVACRFGKDIKSFDCICLFYENTAVKDTYMRYVIYINASQPQHKNMKIFARITNVIILLQYLIGTFRKKIMKNHKPFIAIK